MTSLKPADVGGGPVGQVRPAPLASPDRPGRAARWRAGVPATLRRHWLAAALLTAGLCCGCWPSSPTVPRCSTSTRRGTCTTPSGNDPVGYKGPLRAILLVANLNTVVAVQHLLGLAMAVVIYLLLLRRGVPRWLAALAIAPVLLDAYELQNEQTIMPGTWFAGADRGRLRLPALAAEDQLAAHRRRRHRPGNLGHPRPGRAGPDPARGDLPGGSQAATAGVRSSARRPPCARLSRCPSWPTAPAPTWPLEISPCRMRASRPSTAGWRPPRTAPRSGCRPPSGRCARPGHSRPRDRTGSSTPGSLRSRRTTRICRGLRSTG